MGGFDEVKVLTNPDPQSMQYEVETLFTGRTKDDLVLLFFSGHGIKDDSNNLYFATRITQKNPKGDLIRSTAVPARFIHEVMNNSHAKRQAIILDCCFSGAFDPTLQTKDDGSVDLKGQLGAEGRVVLTSSSSTQYSFEQQGSDLSLYTRYLVEGIETGAGDRDEDGKISMRELHDYATSKVQETAPNMTPKLITLKDMGFEVVLAKAKVTDPKLRYRRQVERYSSRGSISSIGRTILDKLQTQLGLSPEIVREIEAEVLRPYQERLENLQRYQQVFLEAVEHEYPLNRHAQSELEDLREVLGLRQEDVDSIEQQIVTQITQKAESEQKEHQQKLQRYEQEFRRAIEAEYPFSDYVRNGLRDFQHSLELKSEDIEQIERPILTQKEAEYRQKQQDERHRQKQEQERLKQEQKKLEYQQKLQRYEQEFRRAIEAEYPFSDYVRNGLRDFQHSLELKSEDIEQIERPILTQKEAEYRQKQEDEQRRQKQEQGKLKREQEKLEYQRNLQRYEQEFRRIVYPISDNDNVFMSLKDLQQFLGLKDKDIEQIERPILAEKDAEYRKKIESEHLKQPLSKQSLDDRQGNQNRKISPSNSTKWRNLKIAGFVLSALGLFLLFPYVACWLGGPCGYDSQWLYVGLGLLFIGLCLFFY